MTRVKSRCLTNRATQAPQAFAFSSLCTSHTRSLPMLGCLPTLLESPADAVNHKDLLLFMSRDFREYSNTVFSYAQNIGMHFTELTKSMTV